MRAQNASFRNKYGQFYSGIGTRQDRERNILKKIKRDNKKQRKSVWNGARLSQVLIIIV